MKHVLVSVTLLAGTPIGAAATTPDSAPVEPAAPAPSLAAPDDPTQLVIEMQLIQLHPDAQQTLTLDGDVLHRRVPVLGDIPLVGALFRPEGRPRFELVAADEATVRRGDESWALTGGAVPRGAPFDILTAPRLVAAVDQDVSVRIGQTVSYFEAAGDGCYRLRECASCFEGVQIEVRAGAATAQTVEIESLSVEISTVVDREALDGVALDVGAPVMQRRVLDGSFEIATDQVMVMPIAAPDGAPDAAADHDGLPRDAGDRRRAGRC